ncbi:MAG TPA: CopG family antitoxin [Candidatus Kapabacteria bacterium]
MKKNLKTLPQFQSEDEERAFWATHESSDYVDWSKAEVIDRPNAFPNLKLSEDLIEFMIPKEDVENLKSVAEKYHLSRHALARKFVLDALKREQGRQTA